MKYSRFIPRKVAALIKSRDQIKGYNNKLKNIIHDPQKYVYLIGTPVHANMGDHLIALAECSFLSSCVRKEIMDIPTEMFHIYKNKLRRAIPDSCFIFVTGGGWMGDVWPIEEKTIESMVFSFKQNPTLVFPQTVFYQNPQEENSVSSRAKKIFRKCSKVVLCVRDKGSYDYCINHYNNRIILCPDIGLYYKKELHRRSNTCKVGICFREDREKVSHVTENEIINSFQGESIEFVRLSTIHDAPVSCEDRERQVNALIDAFHDCSLIITDRLHGMIYSYIAETPCIAFDNKTHKVSGVYNQWMKDSSSVIVLDDESTVERVVELGKRMIDEKYCKRAKDYNYKDIEEVIKQWKK